MLIAICAVIITHCSRLDPIFRRDNVAVDATTVYWTAVEGITGGSVYRAPLAGGTVTVISSDAGLPLGFAIDAQSVYWSDDRGVHHTAK